jgi:hypothetical protein
MRNAATRFDFDADPALSVAEEVCYDAVGRLEPEFKPEKIACVGAGLGGGFTNTSELHEIK